MILLIFAITSADARAKAKLAYPKIAISRVTARFTIRALK